MYAEILSENDFSSMSGGTVTWSIHDKLSGAQLRSRNFEPGNSFNDMEEGDGEGTILDDSFASQMEHFHFKWIGIIW